MSFSVYPACYFICRRYAFAAETLSQVWKRLIIWIAVVLLFTLHKMIHLNAEKQKEVKSCICNS